MLPNHVKQFTWCRAPKHDKRVAWGDDFAGDAWMHVKTGKVRYCVPGYDLNNEGKELAMKLAYDAYEACKARGHQMSRFDILEHRHSYNSHCEKCGKECVIIPKPKPNEIRISGEAVALDCERS